MEVKTPRNKQDGTRFFQSQPRDAPRPSQDPPELRNCTKTLRKSLIFNMPRIAQNHPEIGPRSSQEPPGTHILRPEAAPKSPQASQKSRRTSCFPVRVGHRLISTATSLQTTLYNFYRKTRGSSTKILLRREARGQLQSIPMSQTP